MKTILFVIVLASCSKSNDVTLLLGPDEDHLSRGFLCRADVAPNDFLMADALVPGTRTLRFALVIDVLELDSAGIFPGCRGEELFALCSERDCRKSVRRHCEEDLELEFPPGFDPDNPMDAQGLVSKFRDALGAKTFLRDLPSAPVLIRVVATKACPAPNDRLEDLALGCAYSCPVQLDQVSGSIAISLDVLDNFCEPAVRACASFPN